ncbi:MAG: TetR/AcrR family transcriptional regulator C-terminal domain-containing protein [Clostridia bacterium]|nr:TetR/AcrR family transcriptional regulator C-terminal domain-containing protein [Clostridia bacterium]
MKRRVSDKIAASTQKAYRALSASLFKLMEEKPFEKISTIDICQSADVPRATFYNHFEDKFDLLRYALKNIIKTVTQDLNNNINQSEYPLKIADNILSFIKANEKLAKKIVSANYNSVLFNEIKKVVFDQLYETLTIKESQERKYLANKQMIAEFYANGIVYSVKTWIEEGMTVPKEEITDALKAVLTANI